MTRYELLDRIGVGGMAEIFRGKAVAAGGFEKPVAIKRILPHLSQDQRFVELLIAEAKVLSLLKHRNIVQIFDVGLGDDKTYFLVMEYVDGKDLGGVQRALEARRGRLPIDLALHIGAEICEALEHAHQARAPDGKAMSLVHRDVSPSNVLLSRAGEVKLTDFGIAKRAEQEATGHGAVRGKFAYISPEQARNEHLDSRSDVFSVGILLWEMLASRRLYSGLGDLEALRAVRAAAAPRLGSEAAIAGTPHAQEIDAVVMAALSPASARRPTAAQLGAQLRTIRYSMESTVGDPATELAKIIDAAQEVERQSDRKVVARPSPSVEFDGTEATVIHVKTADAFAMRDAPGAARARAVIDRFDDEETRQAQLSVEQMAMLGFGRRAHRDSAVPDAPDDEATRMRVMPDLEPTLDPSAPYELPHQHFDFDEATRMVAPRERRTPQPVFESQPVELPPERLSESEPFDRLPPTAPRPLPVSTPPPVPLPQPPSPQAQPIEHTPMPGTVHGHHPPPPRYEPPVESVHVQTGLEYSVHSQHSVSYPGQPSHYAQAPRPGTPMPYAPPPQPPWGPPVPDLYGGRNVAPPPRRPAARGPVMKPWMLMVGALLMALAAFALTRACIGHR